MNYAEMGRVLAKASVFDFRTVAEADVMAWHEACGDLDVDDALAAVTRWYRDRSDRLMPSHLREAVKLVRADRARDARVQAGAVAAVLPDETPAGVRIADLPAETQAMLRKPFRGPLAGQIKALVHERFNGRPAGVPPASV